MMPNGCEHEQCGFGANQLSLTTNLVGSTHFHNQKTSIAYACCYSQCFVLPEALFGYDHPLI